MHTYGMTKAAAGNILLAIPIGIFCGAPFWGYWSDRIGRRKPLALAIHCVMLLIFSSLAVHLPLERWGLVIQFWLLGFTSAAIYLLYAQAKESFPLAIAGTALTALNFFVMLGAAIFQQMTGIIMGSWQSATNSVLPLEAYRWGFGVSACLLGLALVAYAFCVDTSGVNETST